MTTRQTQVQRATRGKALHFQLRRLDPPRRRTRPGRRRVRARADATCAAVEAALDAAPRRARRRAPRSCACPTSPTSRTQSSSNERLHVIEKQIREAWAATGGNAARRSRPRSSGGAAGRRSGRPAPAEETSALESTPAASVGAGPPDLDRTPGRVGRSGSCPSDAPFTAGRGSGGARDAARRPARAARGPGAGGRRR